MLPRELTEKQEAFAAARAMSKSWVDSYRQAYRPRDPKAACCYSNTYRLRRNPRVVERIAELRRQLKPAADGDTLYRKILQAAIALLEKEGDDKARAVAFEWAVAELEKIRKLEADERDKAEARERAEERARIVSQVRSRYAEELPAKTAAVESAEEEPGETSGDGETSGKGDSEEIAEETGERMPAEVEAPEPPEPPRYRMVDVPISPAGHFPVRYARRLVSY